MKLIIKIDLKILFIIDKKQYENGNIIITPKSKKKIL